MSFNKAQFKDLVERVLAATDPDLASPAAVQLVLGTAAQESHGGSFLRQLHGGPAVGAFQMEPRTFDWLQTKYGEQYPYIQGHKADDMETDLRLAIIMCRLRYRVIVLPLPAANDLAGMAAYWDKWYNANPMKGTVDEFMLNYRRFVDENA